LMTFTPDRRPMRPGLSRRQPMRASAAVAVAALLSFGVVACSDDGGDAEQGVAASTSALPASSTPSDTADSAGSSDPALANEIRAFVEQTMDERHLRAVIVEVTKNGETVISEAFGETMTGVPATVDMHFRNGAVAISYVATVLLQLVDEGTVSLDDKLSTWLPEFPHADEVTLGQLARMTSGYADYVQQPKMLDALYADPFRAFTPEELLAYVKDLPLLYEPGTNWSYAHTNYVLLGLAIEEITGTRMDELIQRRVLDPLGLNNTTDPGNPSIPEPVMHAFTPERRSFLQIPAGAPFVEESTFWNPSWTITHGAIQTTDIADLTASAIAIGEGSLLSSESHQAMVSTDLRGFGSPVEGCPTCFQQSEPYSYGVGLVTTGDWVMQNPMFAGQAAAMAYMAEEQVSIAVAVTFEPEAFDADGNTRNEADQLFRELGAIVAPDHAPPIRR
jgi:CubicO group peptidase (beta-lactamase class C family)